jgi:hypothetical protein
LGAFGRNVGEFTTNKGEEEGRGFRLKILSCMANINVQDFQPERRGEKSLALLLPLPPFPLF